MGMWMLHWNRSVYNMASTGVCRLLINDSYGYSGTPCLPRKPLQTHWKTLCFRKSLPGDQSYGCREILRLSENHQNPLATVTFWRPRDPEDLRRTQGLHHERVVHQKRIKGAYWNSRQNHWKRCVSGGCCKSGCGLSCAPRSRRSPGQKRLRPAIF